MSKTMPSMVALLGLLAVAGYQNRDKLGSMINNAAKPGDGSAAPTGLMGQLAGLFGGSAGGGSLSEGLTSLVNRFQAAGHGTVADSWVSTGANAQMKEGDLESAIGPATIAELERTTGLSRSDLLARLSRDLPRAVDHMTPQGRVPTPAEAQAMV